MTKLSIGGRLFGKDRRSDQIKEVMAMRITFGEHDRSAGAPIPKMKSGSIAGLDHRGADDS
jgi:hypothetical protein